jgi:hypothetical protein
LGDSIVPIPVEGMGVPSAVITGKEEVGQKELKEDKSGDM